MVVPQSELAIRVMLVGHQLLLWGLQKLIDGNQPMMQVVSSATDGPRAIEIAHRTVPHVVVVEIDAVADRSEEIITGLINGSQRRILALTGLRDATDGEASILRGASGVVQKRESPETLLRAIEKVHQGELWLDRGTTGRLFVELSRARHGGAADPEKVKIESLTTREREIVVRLANDPATDNRTLALKLFIGEHTLRNHLSHIYDKLGVVNRTQLYLYACRHRLTTAV